MTPSIAHTPDSFPRQYARTRRFSLGEPRAASVSQSGDVLFLRSRGGADPVTCLWRLRGGEEVILADPLVLLAGSDGDLPPEEKARRERLREQADGITAYTTDRNTSIAVFSLQGRLFSCDLATGGSVRELLAPPGSFDARLSPSGDRVAYLNGRQLRVYELASAADGVVAQDSDADVSWGAPDFIAAEELNRFRGFWWSPNGDQIAAARVDESSVAVWHIADPAHPQTPPRAHRYPAAGTTNADVSLHIIATATGSRTEVGWDRVGFPYLVDVTWAEHGGLTIVVSNRAQNHQLVQLVDTTSGAVRTVVDTVDDAWVELLPGTPVWLDADRLLHSTDCVLSAFHDPEGTRALVVHHSGTPSIITPPNLQVRRVIATNADRVLFTATASLPIPGLDVPVGPAFQFVAALDLATGAVTVVGGSVKDPGIHDANGTPDHFCLRSASIDRPRAEHHVVSGLANDVTLASFAEVALVSPRPEFMRVGSRALSAALLLPSRAIGPDERLPVLLDPYGGPHAQRVVASRNAHTTSQWFADQGFAVLVIDGRGTPGIGPRFERALFRDLAIPVLEDQIEGLMAVAKTHPVLDLDRVGIRGWSFGGFLAALAVLRRPDVFHCAIAGAPVTDWRLYDTAYSERYLGDPAADPDPYDRCSLLLDAVRLQRPLQLIHGLADDNVVAAHTLRLSSALLAAGRPHEVLPLTGVTHMTPQETVAENLLLLQVEFLRRALAIV